MSEFWKATLIRAIRTVCQTAVATIGTAMVIYDVDWQTVVSASVLAGILSVLTSISTGLPEVQSAIEATDEDMEGVEAEPYDVQNYDDMFIDDEVEDGEDTVEQEE